MIKAALRSTGVYERLRASVIGEQYRAMTDPGAIAARSSEVAFYRKAMNLHGQTVFDIGANCGDKTDIFLRLGATVIAVEPDPASVAVLRRRFVRFRTRPLPVTIVHAAVSDSLGTMPMWCAPGSAQNTLSAKWVDTLHATQRFGAIPFTETTVETTTLTHLIAQYGRPAFIKIDVEGFEGPVLRGLRQAVPLSFEVNLPEFLEDGIANIRRLSGSFTYTADSAPAFAADWMDADAMIAALSACRASSVDVWCRPHSVAPGASVRLTAR